MWRTDSLEKTLMQEEKGTTEDDMVGWHHRLEGYEFEQAPGVGDRQGSLACCSPWGCRVGHDWTTELNWTLLLLEVTLGLGKAHRHILGWQELASDRLSVSSGKLKSCGKQKDGVFKFQSPTQAQLILTCLHRPALSLEVETYTNAYFYRQQKTCIMFSIHVTHLLTKLMVWWRSTVKTFKG